MAFQFINVFWLSTMAIFAVLVSFRGLRIQACFESNLIDSVTMRRQMLSLFQFLVGFGAIFYLVLCAVQANWPNFYDSLLGLIFQHMSHLL